jgi:hypothetical protein
VGADIGKAGMTAGPADRGAYIGHRHSQPGSLDVKEHLSALGAASSSTAQIVGHGCAYIDRNGERIAPAVFAAHDQLSCSPPQVIELDHGDLTSAKPQPNDQDDYRVVPTPHQGFAVAAGQDQFPTSRDTRQGSGPPCHPAIPSAASRMASQSDPA